MRVKVGNRWYDSRNIPICIEFTGNSRENIINAAPDCQSKYAEFPEAWGSKEEMVEWMSSGYEAGYEQPEETGR